MTKMPSLALSAGIGVALLQQPSAHALKSSPGAADLSIPARSIPLEAAGGAGGDALLHAGVMSAMTRKTIETGWDEIIFISSGIIDERCGGEILKLDESCNSQPRSGVRM